MRNIYEKALQTMKPEDIDNHYSDLYLKVNDQSKKLLLKYDFKCNVTMFISNIPPCVCWYDIPFAYSPYLENIHNKD